MPRWLLARPYLYAGALGWINLHRRNRVLAPTIIIVVLGAAALLTLPPVGAALEVFAQNPVIPFVLLAAGSAVLTARRKSHVYQDLSMSWLAPLAAPASIAVRMSLPPVLQLLLLAVVVGIPVAVGSLSLAGGESLAMAVGGAYLAGFVVGWLAPHDKTVGAPDFHYVAIRKPRPDWATAPRLNPLSYWAVGQARVSTKPKTTAKAMIFVLLALPMGTGGEKVIAIAAGTMVVLYLLALAVSAARVAVAAARWLSVTTLRYVPFTWMLGRGVLVAQLWTCAWVVFFTLAVSVPVALHVGATAVGCVGFSCVDVMVACWFAMKAVGMEPGLGPQGDSASVRARGSFGTRGPDEPRGTGDSR